VGWALWVQLAQGKQSLTMRAPDALWSIPTPDQFGWPLIGAALGGTLGVGLANVLLWKGLLTQSFGKEYVAWEEAARKEEEAKLAAKAVAAEGAAHEASPKEGEPLDQQDYWQAYPHARKEMLREIAFLSPAIGLAGAGWWVATKLAGPWVYNPASLRMEPSVEAPLWLCVLAGCLLGYLIGAGVVWLMRILGSLLFGKEALGLGDVHMMGAVGVCLGWIDPVLAFFGAAFLGMIGFGVGRIFFAKSKTVLPYGPYLAMGTMLVFFAKPVFEWGATALMAASPAINLP
jgi:leader peptidase (prepilin peptidase)/N-methyltransferase